jgi:exonuclease III
MGVAHLCQWTLLYVWFLMELMSRRKWRVLCWNFRGLNSDDRQHEIHLKFDESECDIVCIQETKCEVFDWRLICKFFPKRFNNFAHVPLIGASGGIIVLWNSACLIGQLIEVQRFGLMIRFTSTHNNDAWTLVSVYGPCQVLERDQFVACLYNLQIPLNANWLLLGDFNFIRSPDNRNLPGGNTNDMFLFNEVIGHLGLLELPLKGRKFSWSNMQATPLLE